MVDDVDGRFGGEIGVVEVRRPSAAVVDRAAGRSREAADNVDLHVSEVFIFDQRNGFAVLNDWVKAGGVSRFPARQNVFRQDDVVQQIAAGGLGEEHLVVPCDVETPRVAAF